MARVEVPWFASPPMVNCARSGFVTQGRGSLGLACHCLSWARGEFCVALQTLRAPLCTRPRRRVCAKPFVAHVRENVDIQAVVSGLACRLGRDSASTSGMQDACQLSPLAHGLRTRSGAQQKLLVGDPRMVPWIGFACRREAIVSRPSALSTKHTKTTSKLRLSRETRHRHH